MMIPRASSIGAKPRFRRRIRKAGRLPIPPSAHVAAVSSGMGFPPLTMAEELRFGLDGRQVVQRQRRGKGIAAGQRLIVRTGAEPRSVAKTPQPLPRLLEHLGVDVEKLYRPDTVPFENRIEHRSLYWLLDYLMLHKPDGGAYDRDTDYLGAFPGPVTGDPPVRTTCRFSPGAFGPFDSPRGSSSGGTRLPAPALL